MNDDEIRASIYKGYDWQKQEVLATCNAILWLTQSANGEVPHGGTQPCHDAPNATNPSMTEKSSSNPTEPRNSTMKTATEETAGTSTSTDTEIRMDVPEMLPWTEAGDE